MTWLIIAMVTLGRMTMGMMPRSACSRGVKLWPLPDHTQPEGSHLGTSLAAAPRRSSPNLTWYDLKWGSQPRNPTRLKLSCADLMIIWAHRSYPNLTLWWWAISRSHQKKAILDILLRSFVITDSICSVLSECSLNDVMCDQGVEGDALHESGIVVRWQPCIWIRRWQPADRFPNIQMLCMDYPFELTLDHVAMCEWLQNI